MRYFVSVSYTHLDVYKRQVQKLCETYPKQIDRQMPKGRDKTETSLRSFNLKFNMVASLYNQNCSIDLNEPKHKRFGFFLHHATISKFKIADHEINIFR